IRAAIKKIASPEHTVMDAGCAIGKWLPVLSPLFKKVVAVDISKKNLQIAESKHPQLENVEYLRADMSSRIELPACDVAVCINAILTDSQKKRKAFFANLGASVRENGHLVLVVPSLESWLLTRIVQHRWKIDRHLFNDKFSGKQALERWENIRQGNVDIDEVPTKHYLEEELALLLSQEGFVIKECSKIEYEWETEFVKPPEWLKKPGPWDWMALASRV
ncbi:MAG: class I SAM-dependent methyltransferase, partial [Chitinophagaceae bacterium]|nr:class I SAM-dependent methyltransferase [Chitinophagaceae bacterium]